MNTLIKNANVFDGKNAALQENVHIVIEDNLVKEIVRGAVTEENFEAVYDASHHTVIPGLTDAHVHLSITGNSLSDGRRVDEKAVRSVRFAKEMLLRGFTTVRDAGGITFGLKKNIDNGFLDGPRILPSNAMISQTSGHGDIRANHAEVRIADSIYASADLNSKLSVLADGVDEVIRAVREQLFLGASQIKLMAGGGFSSAYDPIWTVQFSFEEIKAAVDAAADYGTYVMAHLYTPPSMQRAARAGVKCFEHATLLDEETARIVADQGIWITPGPQLGRHYPTTGLPKSTVKLIEDFRDGEKRATELIDKYNLPILYGTDAFGDIHRAAEIQLDDFRLFKSRFGSFRGIVAATGNIHELIQLSTYQNPYPEGKIGVLEEGSFADLLVVNGNPVEDLDILAEQSNIRFIMKDAVVYKNTL
ncbi:metal-dependent hydrolase family protein [Cohnella hashimotonis]|uniref:Amidohydrolase family protein n=1 Tax=Cohnella hashimotonis TaxID=2826895 RepID=A0ABT6TJI7_9BACL|nr:amidohydrolase family protein [Cohnella hashimotonis]MDI4647008.1 amidohydrolase family protein [Cohnella hashimotonis]